MCVQSQRCPEVWGGVWSSSEWTGGMSEPREAPRMSCRQVVSHTFGLRLWCSAAQPTPPTPHPREMMCWWEVLAVILPTRSLSSWPQEATVAAKHRAGEAETPPGAVPLSVHPKREVRGLVAQWCLTLRNPMDCGPPGSSVHGLSQAGILEWVAISSPIGSSRPTD